MSSATEDVEQMQAQIAQYGSVTQFGIRVQSIAGPAGDEASTGYITASSGGSVQDGQYDAGWEIGNWGDTLTFTPR
ncbi:MAG: imidazolonepropionase [Solirubrobacteraceae bacterium]|jgi:hypothetical protein|nr:imidazolonepropionase [Solirubrobacteraceae bacterium]MEA2187940.1 imidazolonepropionase [Solirubrobacteraceae bacterium]